MEHLCTCTYDTDGRMTAKTDPLGNQTLYTYDANGNLLKTTSALGLETSFTYDELGRVRTATDPNGGVVSAQYDANGNITKITDAAGTVSYAYDALNRMVSAHEVGVGLNTTRTYQYDSLGNLIENVLKEKRKTGNCAK